MSPTNILSFLVDQFRTPHVVYNSISASFFFSNLEIAWTRYKDHEKYFRSSTAQLSLSWEISFSLICVTRLFIRSRVRGKKSRTNLIVETSTPPDRHQIPSEWSRHWIWIIRRGALTRKILIIRLSPRPRMLNLGFRGNIELINSCKRRWDLSWPRNLRSYVRFEKNESHEITIFWIISNFTLPFPINNSSSIDIFAKYFSRIQRRLKIR